MAFWWLPYGQEQIQYLFVINARQIKINGNRMLLQQSACQGKTQTLSKDGVHNILGSKNVSQPQPPKQVPKEQPNPNNKAKSSLGQNVTSNPPDEVKNKTVKQSSQPVPLKANKTENPFLVSNPFYLDQQQRERQQIQRKERLRLQLETQKALQAQNAQKDPKQTTKTSSYSKSLDKKKNAEKQWVRLGGLGANIGGDDWMQKKKKLQKMQQFAGQVKSINAEKIKVRPDIPKPKQKQVNPRQKALEYSKNVPKPVIRKAEQQQQIESPQQKRQTGNEQGLTQLQIYEMKHEQLKKMIHNNY